MPVLEAVATAVPEHEVPQAAVVDVARAFLEEHAPQHLPLLPVFENAGVETRYFARGFDWYLARQGWGARNAEFARVGLDLAERAAREALERAAIPPHAIDGIVFVSTTGLATPSLDARLIDRMGLRPEAIRVPVWGLGCAGGVAGLARTADLARARPDERFLLVSLELCSLAFLRSDLSKKNVVAAAIFGDGCAAAVVAGDRVAGEGPRVAASASHVWPGTQDVMGWDVQDEGLAVVFSRTIPDRARDDLPPVLRRFLKENEVEPDYRCLFHPGGSKVLEALASGLGLAPERLEDSREVLRAHGNMSSPTALFVLERSWRRRSFADGEPGVLSALGPGFAAENVLLRG